MMASTEKQTTTIDDIPLADDVDQEVTESDVMKLNLANITGPEKLESLRNSVTAGSSSGSIPPPAPVKRSESPPVLVPLSHQPSSLDTVDLLNPDEIEEKERMIQQVLELQNTLDDLSLRVESVKEENLKLKSENQVLGQYIENLVSASSVFQSTSPKTRKSGGAGPAVKS